MNPPAVNEGSPRFKARVAGGLYVLSLLTAGCAEFFLRGSWGFAGGLVAVCGMAAVTLLLYHIFAPVNRSLSLIAASLNLTGLLFEAIRFSPHGVNIAIVFNGLYCLLIGFLILRSTFMPRVLGVLIALAGLSWLSFVSPPLAGELYPYNVLCGTLGEGSVCLWLLAMGVNAQRWKEQAGGR